MKSLQDALYNWLTIKVVKDSRPDDTAARDTTDLFEEILSEEHGVSDIEVKTDLLMYYLTYQHAGETKTAKYPRELIEIMLDQINESPERYANYPEED